MDRTNDRTPRGQYSMRQLIILLLFIIGCEDNLVKDYPPMEFEYNVSLPQDSNGYYHMELDDEKWQTTQRISAKLTSEAEPYQIERIRINWESSLYWVLGDTLGYIIKRDLNDDLVYVNYDTLYITGMSGQVVPTINFTSYMNCEEKSFGSECEINTMIGPVKTMKNDTLKVTAWYLDFYNEIQAKSIGIILE